MQFCSYFTSSDPGRIPVIIVIYSLPGDSTALLRLPRSRYRRSTWCCSRRRQVLPGRMLDVEIADDDIAGNNGPASVVFVETVPAVADDKKGDSRILTPGWLVEIWIQKWRYLWYNDKIFPFRGIPVGLANGVSGIAGKYRRIGHLKIIIFVILLVTM